MFTNKEIKTIAMEQSARDSSCCADDFCKDENMVVLSKENGEARKYLKLPFYCDLTSYGRNIVASVDSEIVKVVQNYIGKFAVEHCFETPNLHVLDEELKIKGMGICFMAEYFLPDVDILTSMQKEKQSALQKSLQWEYEFKMLKKVDFADLYVPAWGNALSSDRKHLDVLGMGAYHNNKLVGLAGCSADCETMWQIGIDVLPEYREKGIASTLTGRLAWEILERGKVPFYCAAWSNIKSVRNAIKSGFRPAWVQVTAKSREFINDMNKGNINKEEK